MIDRGEFHPGDEASRILAALVESSDDAIIAKDLNGVILSWNSGAERLYGYAAGEVKGRSIALLFPDDRADELPRILTQIRSGQRIEHYETVRRAKDGHLIDVSLTVSPIRDSGGHIVGASTIGRDIANQKRMEAALRTSEARWRSIVESAVDAIIVIDARGKIESFNPAAQHMFGYAEEDVVGLNVNILMSAPDHDNHDAYIARYLATGEKRIIGIGREVVALRRDGSVFRVQLSIGEMIVEGERRFTGILHDLSTRVTMEERLREQASMARLGEMAAVVAHEIRNPLAGIRGAIEVIGSRLPAGSRDATVIREIVTRIDGLNELMKDLLLFSRPPQPRLTAVDVHVLISSTASLLAADPASAGVRVEIHGSGPPVMADQDLLKIVCHNLLVNAAHAMQGKGVINVSIAALGERCEIAIQDSGPGIPREVREKVFEPFFTTKSRGTGLGLPTARRLVEAQSGIIHLTCPPCGGTTVTIQLPAAS